MGLQKRGRTKGKGGWLNYSWSEKNGIGTSISTKLSKNVTLNWFGKGPNRTTVNLGNGWKWVSTNKTKQQTKSTSNTSDSSGDGTGLIIAGILFLAMMWIAGLLEAAAMIGWFFGSIIYTAGTLFLAWVYLSKDEEG